ncbi:hypothetical protein VTK26DRAFT_1359 [Humicola hyalothermophila]
MACRNCGAAAQLAPRLARPLQQSFLDNAHLPLSLRRAGATAPSAARSTTTVKSPRAPPSRRAFHTSPPRNKLELKKLLMGRIAETLAQGQSQYYVYGATERMYKACAAQADYMIEAADRKAGTLKTSPDGEEIGSSKGGPWHNELGLPPTFSTWAQVTMLHMYLLVVRFRCLDKTAQQAWQTQLVNHFFYQAEAKMEDLHDLTSRALRQRYLKDLFVQWRGLLLAYDEGLVKGDAVLASAVWRNLYKAREDVDLRALAAVVGWMRSGIKELGDMADEDIALEGERVFKRPVTGEFRSVDVPTASLRPAFDQAGIRAGEAKAP